MRKLCSLLKFSVVLRSLSLLTSAATSSAAAAGRKVVGQLSSHHEFDEPFAVEFANWQSGHVAAVAHDRDPITEGEDLIQPMTDIQDANALRAQIPRDGEEFLHFTLGERGGGFV